MSDVITTHRRIMDEFDPERRIGLIVDEWGTWHPPAPGRNPAHLWQQNTLRDALVAAITLNLFNQHARQLVMANLAQTVNVLQALCLTEGERLVLTPTYHVFDLYQPHQGATALRTTVESPSISFAAAGQRRALPALTASASIASAAVTISLTNAHVSLPQEVQLELRSAAGAAALRDPTVRVLAHEDLSAHNTFDEPHALRPQPADENLAAGVLRLPPASVSIIRARIS